MFYKKYLAAFCFVAVCFSACSKSQVADNNKSDNSENEIEEIEEIPEMLVTVESSSSTLDSVMLGGSLWTLNKDGYMDWLRDMPAGTRVGAYKNTDANESYPAEIRRDALRTSDWSRRNFVHIVYDSNEYWVQEIFIAVDAKPAIVIESGTPLFSEPSTESKAERWLGQGTLIAVSKKRPENHSFLQASAYVSDYGLVPNRFIESSKVSTNADDITAMQLYAKLHQVNGEGFWVIQDMAVRGELEDIINRLSTSAKIKEKVSKK